MEPENDGCQKESPLPGFHFQVKHVNFHICTPVQREFFLLFSASSSAIRSKRIDGSPIDGAKRLTSSLVDGVGWSLFRVQKSSPRVKKEALRVHRKSIRKFQQAPTNIPQNKP